MPELRAAAQALWEASGAESQAEYEKLRKPTDPELFDDYLAKIDPYTAAKMRVNLIIKSFDNDVACTHINGIASCSVRAFRGPPKFLQVGKSRSISSAGWPRCAASPMSRIGQRGTRRHLWQSPSIPSCWTSWQAPQTNGVRCCTAISLPAGKPLPRPPGDRATGRSRSCPGYHYDELRPPD
jgi:hypothetical protein